MKFKMLKIITLKNNFLVPPPPPPRKFRPHVVCSYSLRVISILTFWRRNYFFNFSTPCIFKCE